MSTKHIKPSTEATLPSSKALQAKPLVQAPSDSTQLLAMLEAMRWGVLLVDPYNHVRYANAAFAKLWGLTSAQLMGPEIQAGQKIHIDTFLKPAARYQKLLARLPQGLFASPEDPLTRHAETLVLEPEPGRDALLELHQSCVPMVDAQGGVTGRMWLFEDVTAQHQAQQTIRRLAELDSLTGLLNRHTFKTLLQTQLNEAGSRPVALLFVDLDSFKLINDLNGHRLGDSLLVGVSQAMRVTFRPEDTIARLGGDEFAIALEGLSPDQLPALCQRLLLKVAQASGLVMAYSSNPVKISCSVGVAWFPTDAQDADNLIAAADQAMCQAKDEGKNTWRTYHKGLQDHAVKAEWLAWSQRLSEALAHGSFVVMLQGIYDAQTQQLDHCEALVRLENLNEPGEFHVIEDFIAHAELSGKILSLDRWMLNYCIEFLVDHPQHVPIAVNISARTLVDPGFFDLVKNSLHQAGLNPHRLHIELTETAVLTNLEHAAQTVERLQGLGCKVSLDDFGSGFTSIAYLKQIKSDFIKMDGKFIKGLADDKENQILLQAVVDIAHASGRKVVAEWVEDDATLALIRRYGLDLVQGYLLGHPERMRPIPPETLF